MSNIRIKEADIIEIGDIKKDMMEKKPLPMTVSELEVWAKRIIAAAGVGATERSLTFALCSMIAHNLSATESFKEDAYFIHCLRKAASNQVAIHMMQVIKAEQEEEKKLAEDTAKKHLAVVPDVLENETLQTPS